MNVTVLIIICGLLLIAYVFDLTSSKTKIPSVILLLMIGWLLKQITQLLSIDVPDLNEILPFLGTIGLILIVLEGSLELEFNRSKLPLVGKSALIAVIPLFALSFGISFVFQWVTGSDPKLSLLNAIPLAVISSAIAIPTARNLPRNEREFITYESSLSDIFGVLFFNFIALHDNFGGATFTEFAIQIIVMLLISFVATIALAKLLSTSRHHIKHIPMILLVVMIYSISKYYHLPGLIFILLFGLFIGNLDEMQHISFIKRLHPEVLNQEVQKFKELLIEITFLVRSLFFLLFGFLLETADILNQDTILWSLGITLSIFVVRAFHLKLFSIPLKPIAYIAPRGLITILLFLSINETQKIDIVNNSLVVQVVILSALVMMFGMMTNKNKDTADKVLSLKKIIRDKWRR